MLKWEDRPFEVAYSLNPAFLAVLLHQAIQSFKKENNEAMPYALIFLTIPLVFYTPIREKLPKNENQFLHEWLKNNPEITIHLHKAISQLVPYTKETIIFAMQHDIIATNNSGNFESSKKFTVDSLNFTQESRGYQMKEKAIFLGKWFAKLGSVEVIYRTLGITP